MRFFHYSVANIISHGTLMPANRLLSVVCSHLDLIEMVWLLSIGYFWRLRNTLINSSWEYTYWISAQTNASTFWKISIIRNSRMYPLAFLKFLYWTIFLVERSNALKSYCFQFVIRLIIFNNKNLDQLEIRWKKSLTWVQLKNYKPCTRTIDYAQTKLSAAFWWPNQIMSQREDRRQTSLKNSVSMSMMRTDHPNERKKFFL